MRTSKQNALNLVPLARDNYLQAFKVQQQCHLNPWSENVFVDCLDSPYFAFQLIESNKVIGYSIGLDVAGEVTLMDIGVERHHRGKGRGKMLLEVFIERCTANNASEIWLEVRQSNKSAINLYTKYGFDLIETRKNYYPQKKGRENGLIMRKILS